MIKIILVAFVFLLPSSAFAEDSQDIHDYYQERLEKSGYYDTDNDSVDDYDDNPFSNKRNTNSPFYTKRTPREDRVKTQKTIKPIELDNGISSQTKSSWDAIRWQLQKSNR